MKFEFINGPWENSVLPTIVRESPAGGDPHILAVIKRVHNPDALYELCRLANAALPNRCHVCDAVAVNADAALCFTCSMRSDLGEIVYDPDRGWKVTDSKA
jgi:hypothetical protein